MKNELPQKTAGNAQIVLTKDKAGLVDDIKAYVGGLKKTFEHAGQHAYLIGGKFTALKESCSHGEFLKLCDQHLPEIPTSTRCLMMTFFNGCQAQISTSRNIRPAELQLTNGELPTEHRKAVLAAIFEVSEGKTWTAVAREMGVSRKVKDKVHHPRRELTVEQQVKLEREAAELPLRDAIRAMESLVTLELCWEPHIERPIRREVLDAAQRLVKHLKTFGKRQNLKP